MEQQLKDFLKKHTIRPSIHIDIVQWQFTKLFTSYVAYKDNLFLDTILLLCLKNSLIKFEI